MLQEVEHALLVVRGQFLVERATVDCLAEQLGDFPARVVDRLAELDRPTVVRRRIVQQCAATGINLDLEGDAELSAITEDGLMMAGKSRRARIPVQALVEVADLARAISHVEPSAGPDGPVAAAHAIAGFEHCAIIAGLVELVGRREPGHTSAEHGDLGSVTVDRKSTRLNSS